MSLQENTVTVKLAVLPENLKWVYVAVYDKNGLFDTVYPVPVTQTEFEIPLTGYDGKGRVSVFWLDGGLAPIRANKDF